MTNIATKIIAQDGRGLDGRQLLTIDPSAIRMAYMLSTTTPQSWLPYAYPPFQRAIVDWSPREYLDEIEGVDRTIYTVAEGERHNSVAAAVQNDIMELIIELPDGKLMPSPFVVRIGAADTDPADAYVRALIQREGDAKFQNFMQRFVQLGWGLPAREFAGGEYPREFRVYPNTHYIRDDLDPDTVITWALDNAGQVRVALALFALLNRNRETVIVPPNQRDGRTVVRGRNVPKYKPHLVVLRPDAIRRVTEPNADDETLAGVRKRAHEVRRHIRRYRNGKEVWVREHNRGDPALGVVQKRYVVEADPNKNLPQGGA